MKHNPPAAPRNLTPLYCLHQAVYFFAMAGTGAFAVTYLMSRGFGAAQIGVMLAATNILSCVLQPMIGSYVDKTSVSKLHSIVPAFLIAALFSLASLELLPLPLPIVGLLYIVGHLSFSVTIPLLNPLCAHYSQNGFRIDYGAGSGIGSLSFSFASLAFGYILARLGASAMIFVVLLFIVLQLLLVLRYPRIQPVQRAAFPAVSAQRSLSVFAFARRYKWFMATMLGVMCIAACHSMAENYLIHIFNRIGGGSEHVGVALFIACVTDAPFMIYFERIQRRINIVTLMRLSGLFYIAKAVLLVFAPSIFSVYLIELLQTVTYAFLFPCLYYLVIDRIRSEDMAKGQTLASATFTLGAALGNSLGGAAIEQIGLSGMLVLAAGIAGAGTLLLNIAILKRDIPA